ncbi:MAG: imidazole glycerol phosphate synthase subunit HisH [Candidatus Poribacteria bacterium]|nr:imidazole glycerol phosphate synthase subunit HisH [Candidatus Poribacteria bacterium]
MIAVIDYGMGNLRSVQKGFEHIGAQAEIVRDPNRTKDASALVLPGQGEFGSAMRELRAGGMDEAVLDFIRAGKPFMGVCIGLQALFESSEEAPETPGLGVLPGVVKRFQPGLKIPHMGWNQLELRSRPPHLRDVKEGDYVYFVHSYYAAPAQESDVAAATEYGERFASAVYRENIFASQFHPEKSQSVGLNILRAFAELAE